jgi:hypothetical protein
MKKSHTISITVATLLSLLGVGAATASFLPGGVGDEWQQWAQAHLGSPLEEVQAQLGKGTDLLNTIMKGSLGGVWDQIQTKTGTQTPDPYQLRTTKTGITAGMLTTSPIVHQRDTANLYDQELGRATAASVLGETGRQWLAQETKQTAAIVQSNQQGLQAAQGFAQQAQSLTSTQDVMKNNAKEIAALAGIVTNQSRLTADNHTALLKLQQLQGIVAQLSANTSEGIDESNRRERVARQIEMSSATRSEIYIPGLYRTNKSTPTRP